MSAVDQLSGDLNVDVTAGVVERWLTEPFERGGWRGILRRAIVTAAVGGMVWACITMVIGGIAGRMSGTEVLWAIVFNEIATCVAVGVASWVAFRSVTRLEEWEAAGSPGRRGPADAADGADPPDQDHQPEHRRLRRRGASGHLRVVSRHRGSARARLRPLRRRVPRRDRAVVARRGAHDGAGQPAGDRRDLRRVPPSVGARGTAHVTAHAGADPGRVRDLVDGDLRGGLSGLFDEPIEHVGFAVVVSLVFAGVTAVLLRFAVTEAALRPVDDLIRGVERISGGDLRSRVPITSADEFAVLCRAVNEMTERLAAHDAELRASRARIVTASHEARRQVERDLHDGAQQHLILLQLRLGQAKRMLETDSPELASTIDRAGKELAHALAELRDLAHGIYPVVLESDGLLAAMKAAAEASTIPVTVESEGLERYAQELEAAVYFCCLEALQNAAKHAGDGATVTVRLSETGGQVEFSVVDDGRGFDDASIASGSGLQNMGDRIGALGGELRITSTPGGGTTVSGTVPADGPDRF